MSGIVINSCCHGPDSDPRYELMEGDLVLLRDEGELVEARVIVIESHDDIVAETVSDDETIHIAAEAIKAVVLD